MSKVRQHKRLAGAGETGGKPGKSTPKPFKDGGRIGHTGGGPSVKQRYRDGGHARKGGRSTPYPY